jgi:hypothetical protein
MQQYRNNVQDRRGNAIAGVTVQVLHDGSPITVYTDDGVTPASELTTNENGEFTFFAPSGNYTVQLSGGITQAIPVSLFDPQEIRDIQLSAHQYGVLSVERGASSPASTKAAIENLRVLAESLKARVVFEAGTYLLPEEVYLDADNTEWVFQPGAILKLHNTQAVTSFIIFNAPVNQRVVGLTVDANRAAQNRTLFGDDNCAVLVVDADGCAFDKTEVISSPAKGFALVSTPGGTTRNTTITTIRGQDCGDQVVLVDGNNITGLFENVTINGVDVGATGGAGFVLADGVHNIKASNVVADVQNTLQPAVYIRDSFDLQLSNVRGLRGTNGIQIERLNGFCGRIELENITGEQNQSSGFLLLGAENISAGVVVGRNNGVVGVNVAATGGGYRSKNIHLGAPVGVDTRGTPAQQYGILIQGADGCTVGKHTAYGNTLKQISIIRANTTNVRADVERIATGTTGSIAAGSEAVVTVNWSTPFEDADIDIVGQNVAVGTTSLSLSISHLVAVTQNAVQFMVKNLSGTTPYTGTLTVNGRRKV